MPQSGDTDRRWHSVLNCLVIYLLPNLWRWYFENEWTNYDANWHKWSTGQWHGTINFGGQEVKGQGHVRPKIDLEAWRRHNSLILNHVGSSSFSTSIMYLSLLFDVVNSNMTVGQSSLISLTHHFYDWHPGSRCSRTCNQLTSKVDGGITGSRLMWSVST